MKNGWTVVTDVVPDVGANGVVHYQRNGVEAWATVVITGTRVEVQMIEIAPVPVSLTLKAPASTPEQMDPQQATFLISAPCPVQISRWRTRPRPVLGDTERRRPGIIASGSLRRSYTPPISNALFLAVYKPALLKASWEILDESNGGDASLLSHYSKNGRNIWAYLHNDANGYTIDIGRRSGGSGS